MIRLNYRYRVNCVCRRLTRTHDDEKKKMLTKEYRICLPMSVDEYRIAQLYMIQVCDKCSSGNVYWSSRPRPPSSIHLALFLSFMPTCVSRVRFSCELAKNASGQFCLWDFCWKRLSPGSARSKVGWCGNSPWQHQISTDLASRVDTRVHTFRKPEQWQTVICLRIVRVFTKRGTRRSPQSPSLSPGTRGVGHTHSGDCRDWHTPWANKKPSVSSNGGCSQCFLAQAHWGNKQGISARTREVQYGTKISQQRLEKTPSVWFRLQRNQGFHAHNDLGATRAEPVSRGAPERK